jgi:hypothetical protein
LLRRNVPFQPADTNPPRVLIGRLDLTKITQSR